MVILPQSAVWLMMPIVTLKIFFLEKLVRCKLLLSDNCSTHYVGSFFLTQLQPNISVRNFRRAVQFKYLTIFWIIVTIFANRTYAQKSVAREWIEVALQCIKNDYVRPPVHARTLFHLSSIMYDAWATYDTVSQPYLLGQMINDHSCPFLKPDIATNIEQDRNRAISYAAYRLLWTRFNKSPQRDSIQKILNAFMSKKGYNISFMDTHYQMGNAAALGNHLFWCIYHSGLNDGSNEEINYLSPFYKSVNPPLIVEKNGNPSIKDPNRWQPLVLKNHRDQFGNPLPSEQLFQTPEWGRTAPFALEPKDSVWHFRDDKKFIVYHDVPSMPKLDTVNVGNKMSELFKWNFAYVLKLSAQLTPDEQVIWDISPNSMGNFHAYPNDFAEYPAIYDSLPHGILGSGYSMNPITQKTYPPQYVLRGDFVRVITQFWADGPKTETPPGHWYSILNYVNDNPMLQKRIAGKGRIMNDLEWDVKSYFVLGAAMHDAAIAAWSIKGWHDGVRPISAIRYMATLGQSSDTTLSNYHPAGLPLIPGLIESIALSDTLYGFAKKDIGKIKIFAWNGHSKITAAKPYAGVDWILAESWEPFQEATFVTPPFGGYISGHSTFSNAAAKVITLLTGNSFFPNGMGEYKIPAKEGVGNVESGPTKEIVLQWATYQDAADQCSLSRIWGGIHPPCDDIPGRLIGHKVAETVFHKAIGFFHPQFSK